MKYQYRIPSKEPYGNEVYLTGQNLPSICCQPLDFWYTSLKGLDLTMLGSVGERALKLQAVKVGGLKKKSASWPQSASLLGFDSWSRSNHSESLMASNFAAH